MVHIDDILDQLLKALLSVALKRDWGFKYAKFAKDSRQSLLVHAINTFSVTKTISKHLFELDDDSLILACLAAFLHDYQKESEDWQSAAIKYMNGEHVPEHSFDHDDGSDEQKAILLEILKEIESESKSNKISNLSSWFDRIINIVVYTHDSKNKAVTARRKQQVGPIDQIASVVRLADAIASIKTPADILKKKQDLDLPHNKDVTFEYHEISLIRGLVSSFLNQALLKLMEESGYIPLLHFGNGTVYIAISKPKKPNNAVKRIKDLIDEQVKEFQTSDIYLEQIANAVIGPLNQTTWPVIQLVTEKTVPQIIDVLSNLPRTNLKDSDGKSKLAKVKANERSAVQSFLAKINADPNQVIADMYSDFNMFIYVADFLKNYRELVKVAGIEDEFQTKVDSWLNELLGNFTLDELCSKKVGNTAVLPDRCQIILKLWRVGEEDLHKKARIVRRKILAEKFKEILQRVLHEFGKYAPSIFSENAKNLLLSDIAHVPFVLFGSKVVRELAQEPYDRYTKGKRQTKLICSLCGAEASTTAPATLFGDGSEKFTNRIAGGENISNKRKAQVCEICFVEGALRAFFFPTPPAITFVVIPDLSLGPELAKQWAENVESFVKKEKIGLSPKPWNMVEVYNALAKGEIINNALVLAELLKPTKNSVKQLATHLENQAGPNCAGNVPFSGKLPIDTEVSFENLAEAHLRGLIQIEKEFLEGFRLPTREQGTSYLTPNHLFIFERTNMAQDEEESKSTTAIRTFFFAMLLAVVFHARVITMEGFQPITDLNISGIVRTNLPAPAAVALATHGFSEEMPRYKVKNALQELAALTLISLEQITKLGKDRLLRLLVMNRGAILRRAQTELGEKLKGGKKHRLVKWLNVLPDIINDNPIVNL